MSDCSLYCVLLDNKIRNLDRISEIITAIEENVGGQSPPAEFTPELVTLNNILINMLKDNSCINFTEFQGQDNDTSGDVIKLWVKKCGSCTSNVLNTCTLVFTTSDGAGGMTSVPLSGVNGSVVFGEGYCYLVGTKLAGWVTDAKAVLQAIRDCCCDTV